jgi:hypothetical protein
MRFRRGTDYSQRAAALAQTIQFHDQAKQQVVAWGRGASALTLRQSIVIS